MNTLNRFSGILAVIAIVIALIVSSKSPSAPVPSADTTNLGAVAVNQNGATNYSIVSSDALIVGTNCSQGGATSTTCLGNGQTNLGNMDFNGIVSTSTRISFSISNSTATTTPCSIKSPAATSTLEWADLYLLTGTSTSVTWTLASSTTAFSSTTAIYAVTPATSSGGALIWYPSQTVNGSIVATTTGIIAPSSWINWVAQSSVNGFAGSGSCQAVFNLL